MSLTLSDFSNLGQQPSLDRRGAWCSTGHVDGFGSFITVEAFDRAERLSGLGSWIVELFGGKPQSWWNKVDGIQKDIVRVSNDISSIGQETWDRIMHELAGMYQSGQTPPYGFTGRFPNYEFMMNELRDSATKMLVTKSHSPSDEEIKFAETLINVGKPAVDFAQKYAPEVQAHLAQERAKMEAMIADAPLMSPEQAGLDEFERQVKNRANLMFNPFSGGSMTYIIIGAVAALGLVFFLKR